MRLVAHTWLFTPFSLRRSVCFRSRRHCGARAEGAVPHPAGLLSAAAEFSQQPGGDLDLRLCRGRGRQVLACPALALRSCFYFVSGLAFSGVGTYPISSAAQRLLKSGPNVAKTRVPTPMQFGFPARGCAVVVLNGGFRIFHCLGSSKDVRMQ